MNASSSAKITSVESATKRNHSKLSEPEVLVMHEFYKDHKQIEQTLKAFEDQIGLYRSGKKSDFTLMYDVMSYLVLNPDQYHHPLEEAFFAMLAELDTTFKVEVDITTKEHSLIKAAGEMVLECLAEQIRSPCSLKESHIIEHSEKYISLLRHHIDREETKLFRPGRKLLHKRDWRELNQILHSNPDDPLFDQQSEKQYPSLRAYLKERVEISVEIIAEQEYRQISSLIENIGILSSSASEINNVVSHHSKNAWQDTKTHYRHWLKGDPFKIKGLLTVPLSCSLDNFDHTVKSLSEISKILHRAQDSLTEEPPSPKDK